MRKGVECKYRPHARLSVCCALYRNRDMDLETAIDSAVESVGLTSLKPLQREAIRVFQWT